MIPGQDMPSPYALQFDRRPLPPGVKIDCGWIGEDAEGIWLTRHPEIALTQDPELWRVHTEFCLTPQREIDLATTRSLSHWYMTAWVEQLGALERDRTARMKRPVTATGASA